MKKRELLVNCAAFWGFQGQFYVKTGRFYIASVRKKRYNFVKRKEKITDDCEKERRRKNMNKKKVVACLLAATMTAGMLAGCGGSSGSSDSSSSSSGGKDKLTFWFPTLHLRTEK